MHEAIKEQQYLYPRDPVPKSNALIVLLNRFKDENTMKVHTSTNYYYYYGDKSKMRVQRCRGTQGSQELSA